MSPNSNSSVEKSSIPNKDKQIFNDSKKLGKRLEISQNKIIVTKHLSEPCFKFYSDIFHTVLIECQDPSHDLIPSSEIKSESDDIHNQIVTKTLPLNPNSQNFLPKKKMNRIDVL